MKTVITFLLTFLKNNQVCTALGKTSVINIDILFLDNITCEVSDGIARLLAGGV